MRTRKEIKQRAKTLLGRQIFGNKWLYMLLACLLFGLIVGAISSFVIGFIFIGIFAIGFSKVTLSVARGEDEQADMGKLFFGFNDGKLGDYIILGILHELFIFLWSLLFIIPGIVKSYSYSMAYFIKLDHPELEANACITESRKLMKGHKWQLFVMDLSFIGWYIVGMLCLGVGVLWVDAYHETAKAEFYRALLGEENPIAQ